MMCILVKSWFPQTIAFESNSNSGNGGPFSHRSCCTSVIGGITRVFPLEWPTTTEICNVLKQITSFPVQPVRRVGSFRCRPLLSILLHTCVLPNSRLSRDVLCDYFKWLNRPRIIRKLAQVECPLPKL